MAGRACPLGAGAALAEVSLEGVGVGPGKLPLEIRVQEKSGLRAVHRTERHNGPPDGLIPSREEGSSSPGGARPQAG